MGDCANFFLPLYVLLYQIGEYHQNLTTQISITDSYSDFRSKIFLMNAYSTAILLQLQLCGAEPWKE